MTRRSFLLACFGLFVFTPSAAGQPDTVITDDEMLRHLLDALIPTDDTPGAREAALHRKLLARISRNRAKQQRYAAGLSLVRKEIQNAGVNTVVWDDILEEISSSRFFAELRQDALLLFYADPIGWKAVGYEGPPLTGYPDYHRCRS